jgi:hypothetical protein
VLEFVAAQLNNRPRKRRGSHTPSEALDRLLSERHDPPSGALTGWIRPGHLDRLTSPAALTDLHLDIATVINIKFDKRALEESPTMPSRSVERPHVL